MSYSHPPLLSYEQESASFCGTKTKDWMQEETTQEEHEAVKIKANTAKLAY